MSEGDTASLQAVTEFGGATWPAVPLWVVLGAGASFANVLIEEIGRRGDKPADADGDDS